MKKLLFLKLLVLVACLSSALSATAYDFAAKYNDFYFYYNITSTNTVEVTYFDLDNNYLFHPDQTYIIPSTVTNPNTNRTYTVTAIGDQAFQRGYYTTSYLLTNITIPNTVTRIGDMAFFEQRKLTSLTLPSSITSIGDNAFSEMDALTSLNIPNSVTSLGEYFLAYNDVLTSVTFGTGVTEIPNFAVRNCPKLANLAIGSNVTRIGWMAFYQDSTLTEVVIPDKVTTISDYAFQNCRRLQNVTLGSAVNFIGDRAFSNCSWFVHNGTTYYNGMNITCKCATPPTIEYKSVFDEAQYYYAYIYVPTPHSMELYKAAPYWSEFSRYYATQKYDFLVNGIYYNITGTNTVEVTNKWGGYGALNSDSDYSYSGNVTIPNTVTYNGTTYNVTSIGEYAFFEARHVNLNSPGEAPSLRAQGDLKSVTIYDNVTTIKDYAFWGCTGLTKVTLGTGVTSIGSYAFNNCTSLTSVISRRTTPPTITSSTFDSNHYSTATLYVPSTTAVNNYKAATYWRNFTNITIFEAYACYNVTYMTLTFYCDGLRSSRTGTNQYYTSVTYDLNTGNNPPAWYGSPIIYVAFDESFSNARPTSTYQWFAGMGSTSIVGLSYLNTENVTNMSQMFLGCNMPGFDVSNFNTANVTDMSYMFSNCLGLTSFDLSNFNTAKVTNMGYMFNNCSNLTSLDVSSFNTAKVTNMGYMFNNCSNLASLDVSSFNTAKVTNMDVMFAGCSNLTTIYVGSGWTTNAVTSSAGMFSNCLSLVGGKGTTYNSSHIDKAYAHIDGGPSNPGYFTDKNASQMGDVNGDGSVTITDLTELIDSLLNGIEVPTEIADANGDGQVNIADVTALIDMLLGS